MIASQQSILGSLKTIFDEVKETAIVIPDVAISTQRIASRIDDAERIFVHGAGRSRLGLQMTAMRLMHLGKPTYVVGETTTPGITDRDLILLASGSGTTSGVVRAADKAREVGADVAAITTDPASPLAQLADTVCVVPAAKKLDRSGETSVQYAGSLFEQTVMLLGDALFHTLWQRSGLSGDEIWPRHANIE